MLQRDDGVFARYELPQYGSRRRLLSPSGMYDEYGEVVVENDGGYYYSPHGTTAEEVSVPGVLILSAARGRTANPCQMYSVIYQNGVFCTDQIGGSCNADRCLPSW